MALAAIQTGPRSTPFRIRSMESRVPAMRFHVRPVRGLCRANFWRGRAKAVPRWNTASRARSTASHMGSTASPVTSPVCRVRATAFRSRATASRVRAI